jgi:hypothetical protein
MKSIVSKIVKPLAQILADQLVLMLEINANSKFGTLDMYEQLMGMAVTLDYVCTEELGIDLD